MDAVFLHGIKDMRIGPLSEPRPVDRQVPLAISTVGICGSDLHYYLEGGIGSAQVRSPFVPGHEFAGRVLEDREDLGLRRGQLVAVDPAKPCGHCEWCRADHPNLCPHVEFTGAPPFNGALTRTLMAEPRQIFPVPDGMTAVQAAMLEPLGVAIHAIDMAKPRLLESVAVIGCGPINLLILQLLRLSGVGQIYAVDPVDYRAQAAQRLGADAVADRHEAVADLTQGRGTDLVIEATNSPLGFQHAAEAVRIGGRLVLVGIPEGDGYTLEASLVRRKGLSIKLSRRMGHVYPRAITLVAEGKVDVDSLVSHHFALEDTEQAFVLQAEYRDHAMKSVIYPNGMES